jgi:O-antigen/teichoic acid export membrane protein
MVARVVKGDQREGVRRLCRTYSLGLTAFFVLAGGTLILAGPLALRLLFGTDYVRFAPLVAPVVAAAVISALASGVLIGIRALGQGRRLAALQAASSIAMTAIVAFCLPFGITTVAWGFAAAEVFRTALAWSMFQKVVPTRSHHETWATVRRDPPVPP